MSTRSCIAKPAGDGWEGVYCHSDGYPSFEGRLVVRYVRQHGAEALHRLIDIERAGFSVFPEQPYSQRESDAPEAIFTSADEADGETPLFIEWVYVVARTGMVTVLASHDTGRPTGKWEGSTYYGWHIVGQVDSRDPDAERHMLELQEWEMF